MTLPVEVAVRGERVRSLCFGLLLGAALGVGVMWAWMEHPAELAATREAYEALQAEHLRTVQRLERAAQTARDDAAAQRQLAEEVSASADQLAEQVQPTPAPPPSPPPEPEALARTPPDVAARLRYWEQVFAPQARRRMDGLARALTEQERATAYWRAAADAASTSAERWQLAHRAQGERAEAAEERVRAYDRVVVSRRGALAVGLAAAAAAIIIARR